MTTEEQQFDGFDDIVEHEYLFSAWTNVRAILVDVDQDDLTKLGEAARILCDALQQLLEDQRMWAAFGQLVADQALIEQINSSMLQDLEDFLDTEVEILTELAGLSIVDAAALAENARLWIKLLRTDPNFEHLEALRAALGELHRQACSDDVLEALEDNPGLLRRGFRFAWRGLAVIGGAALLAANLVGLATNSLDGDAAYSSGVAGATGIRESVE